MTLLITILASYILTYIFVKIGIKIDKNEKAYPAPNFIVFTFLVPYLNCAITLIAVIMLFTEYNEINLLEQLQNYLFYKDKNKNKIKDKK